MNARRGQIVSGWWRTDSPGNVHRALTVVFIRTLQYKWNLLLRLWLRNQTAIWMHSHHRLQVSFVKGREEGNLTKSKYRFEELGFFLNFHWNQKIVPYDLVTYDHDYLFFFKNWNFCLIKYHRFMKRKNTCETDIFTLFMVKNQCRN